MQHLQHLLSIGLLGGILRFAWFKTPMALADCTSVSAPPRVTTQNVTEAQSSFDFRLWHWDDEVLMPTLKRLELIHIPKTGGSTLEALAAAHNVSWGTCHYLSRLLVPGGRICPPHQSPPPSPHHPQTLASHWHTPLSFMKTNPPLWTRNATFFMVVRNPYTRILSEWNYNSPGGSEQRTNATFLNTELSKILRLVYEAGQNRNETTGLPVRVRQYCIWDCHYIPQTDYLVQDVHILRQETLADDFRMLAHRYQLGNWTFPKKPTNLGHGKMTVDDLTPATQGWIVKAYAQGFENFGYSVEPPLSR